RDRIRGETMKRLGLAVPLLALCAFSCKQKGLTRAEAREALDEAQLATQATSLTSGSVEITTNFTIGGAIVAAAEELRSFYAEQLPCAEVNLSGATLSIEYGVDGICRYREQTYRGRHSITISRNDMDNVVVDHVWEELGNERVEVNGNENVPWSFDHSKRHVQPEI